MQDQVGRKFDQGKAPLSLLFHKWIGSGLGDVARVIAYGAAKYGHCNWQFVPDAKRRYEDAAVRHLAAYCAGEERDEESGLPHLAHVATNILFRMAFDNGLVEVVDEPAPEAVPPTKLSVAPWNVGVEVLPAKDVSGAV